MSAEQRRALESTIPTTDVVRDAVTFPRDRLGEPLDISADRFDAWLANVREVAVADLAAAHRAIAEEARADGDSGRAHLHDWAADRAEIYAKEHTP